MAVELGKPFDGAHTIYYDPVVSTTQKSYYRGVSHGNGLAAHSGAGVPARHGGDGRSRVGVSEGVQALAPDGPHVMNQSTDEAVHHPIFARLLTRIVASGEARGQGEHRREMLTGLSGRVIEVGAGNGPNFRYYPTSVTEVVAIEPESYLRELATRAAANAPVPVRVMDGLADELPVDEKSFDAGVASLMLCSVADQSRALSELFRVIRPGGELRFYEHVIARSRGLARVQRVVDKLFWPRVGGGCHASRDTAAAIVQAGFDIEACRRFAFRPCVVTYPTTPHIIGSARRPGTPVR